MENNIEKKKSNYRNGDGEKILFSTKIFDMLFDSHLNDLIKLQTCIIKKIDKFIKNLETK